MASCGLDQGRAPIPRLPFQRGFFQCMEYFCSRQDTRHYGAVSTGLLMNYARMNTEVEAATVQRAKTAAHELR
jgi:hypothetical protein